jgi:hypothetical protein
VACGPRPAPAGPYSRADRSMVSDEGTTELELYIKSSNSGTGFLDDHAVGDCATCRTRQTPGGISSAGS